MAPAKKKPNTDPLFENAHLRVKSCRRGTLLYNAGDIYVGRSLDLYGEFSEGEVKIFEQILKPDMVAVDAGANIGCHTLAMARLVAPKGAVFAVEAQRVLHQVLCANVALNAITNVVTHHAALGDAEDTIFVPQIDYEKGGNYGGIELGGFERGERVAVKTIDGLGLPSCQFIKIDVEGMENEVLAGATETLARHRPVLYVENDRRDRSRELIDRLFAADYRLFWHLPTLFNPDNHFGNSENVFGNLISRNMFCLPKDSPLNVTNFHEITSPDEEF